MLRFILTRLLDHSQSTSDASVPRPRTLQPFTPAKVASCGPDEPCYVTIGPKVYDVTDFAQDHPGGADLLVQYAGRDVEQILRDEASHVHSETAYDILDDSLVGYLVAAADCPVIENDKAGHDSAIGVPATGPDVGTWTHPRTGMSCEADLSRETDVAADYKTHRFLDLDRPLFLQLWYGGFTKAFYLEQIHRPRHYKGGASAPLFGNFLEPLTKTAWWVVPAIWLPCICYGIFCASKGLASLEVAAYFGLGLFLWTLIEYLMHRFLFHVDRMLPDNRVGIMMHFLFHGIHHYLPMDKYRLVLPPVLFLVMSPPFWHLAHAIFYYSWHAATAVFFGSVLGYVWYDLTHYFIHHDNLPLWFKGLKKYHLQHHFLDYQNGYGVTSRFWDKIFCTELKSPVKAS